jgi:hypothetical protein
MADVAAPEAEPKAAEAAAAAQDLAKTAPKAVAETAAEQKDTGTAPEQQDVPQVTFKVQTRHKCSAQQHGSPPCRLDAPPLPLLHLHATLVSKLLSQAHTQHCFCETNAYCLLQLQVQYGKSSAELKRPATSTIADLKAGAPGALAAHRLLPFADAADRDLGLAMHALLTVVVHHMCHCLSVLYFFTPGSLMPVLQAKDERRCCTLSLACRRRTVVSESLK